MYREWKKIEFSKALYMNLETTRLRGRPRNRWQDGVREDGRLVGGKGWKERIYNRQEWKKLLRMATNRHILHMPTEWMNELINENELTEMFTNSASVCYKCNVSALLQFLIEIHFKFLFPLSLILFNSKTDPPSEVCYQHNTFFWLLIYLLAVTPLKKHQTLGSTKFSQMKDWTPIILS